LHSYPVWNKISCSLIHDHCFPSLQGSKTQVHRNFIHNWVSELIKFKPVRLLKDGYKVMWFTSVSLSLRYLERCGPIHCIFWSNLECSSKTLVITYSPTWHETLNFNITYICVVFSSSEQSC
jgi:hypothetical protein